MQRKLFYLSVFIFLFSFITTTFSTKENKTNTKRKRLFKNLQNHKTQDNSQNELNSFVSRTTDNLQSLNIQNRETSNVSFNLLKSKDDKYFYFHSNLLNTQDEQTFSFDLLNKLLETKKSNVFRFIFSYLSLFELELNFKCISKTFYHLYEKILQEEKTFLQPCLKNEKVFLENTNYTRQYFDFFENRLWNDPERIEYANVDCFFENLVLLPKNIKQIISFKFVNVQYKYVLCKNGHLSILKQNMHGNFLFTSLEKDFEKFNSPFYKLSSYSLDSLQENCRFIYVREFRRGEIYIHLYKNDNLSQSIRHVENYSKLLVTGPVPSNSKVFLKNFTGFLHHHRDFASVNLWKFEKQNNGIYKRSYIFVFKQNVKEIKSKDFEHYAQDVQFILKTNKD